MRFGAAVRDTTVFALDRVLFIGHPIAAVAATSLEIAEQALAAIDIEFEDLPSVFDPEAAMDSDVLIHPEWETYKALPIIARSGNISGRARMKAGDVDSAFATAHRVYEHRFTTALVHPGYTEPRAAVADWDANGNVTVWCNTQLPFDMQNTLAEIVDLPAARVRVVVPGIGGGFGGKLRIGVEHFAALLARKTARPVKSHQHERRGAYRGPSATSRGDLLEDRGRSRWAAACAQRQRHRRLRCLRRFRSWNGGHLVADPGRPVQDPSTRTR